MAKRTRPPVPLGMVLIRVVTGAILLAHGWDWLKSGELDGRLVLDAVTGQTAGATGWVAWWGENVLLSNPDAFAFFWRWGALLIGIAFALGALTRPAGLIGVVFLMHGFAYGPEHLTLVWILLTVACFGCAVSGAGRRIGLDAMFDQHFPSWVTWSRSQSSGFLS